MDLVLGTFTLRPYVFAFLAAFLAAGFRDLGYRRTLVFAAWVWPLAWLAEFSSTLIGIPFGLYHYTGATRDQELFVAGVPFFDSLSFTFLAYAAFSLARVTVYGADGAPGQASRGARTAIALVGGLLMMLLDVVIDPLAVRGDRWFLGRIFYYPDGGVYFGVPLSNFLGWLIVGAVGIGGYLGLTGDAGNGRPAAGVALYYAVFAFNVVLTAWIGERALAATGLGLHAIVALIIGVARHRGRAASFRARGLQGA